MLYPDFIPNQDFRVRAWDLHIYLEDEVVGVTIRELTLLGWAYQDDNKAPRPVVIRHGDTEVQALPDVDIDTPNEKSVVFYTSSGELPHMANVAHEYLQDFARGRGIRLVTQGSNTVYEAILRSGQQVETSLSTDLGDPYVGFAVAPAGDAR